MKILKLSIIHFYFEGQALWRVVFLADDLRDRLWHKGNAQLKFYVGIIKVQIIDIDIESWKTQSGHFDLSAKGSLVRTKGQVRLVENKNSEKE